MSIWTPPWSHEVPISGNGKAGANAAYHVARRGSRVNDLRLAMSGEDRA